MKTIESVKSNFTKTLADEVKSINWKLTDNVKKLNIGQLNLDIRSNSNLIKRIMIN